MSAYKLISADSHIVEPPDMYSSRFEPRFRDHMPRMERRRTPTGREYDAWMLDGQQVGTLGAVMQAGQRFEDPSQIDFLGVWEDVRKGAYDAAAMLVENEEDGIWGSVIYPTAGLQLYMVPDLPLLSACFRAYNDWLVEFCEAAPERFRGIALINVEDVDEAIRELTRARHRGLAGGMITVAPAEDRSYDHTMYEPFWAAAQDLDAPISLHVATNRPTPYSDSESNRTSRASLLANADYWVRVSLGHLILEGVFERYPRLRVGSAEHEIAWVPYFLDRLDYTYTQRARRTHWVRYRTDVLPSDFFRQNAFLSFQEDAMGIRDRALIGVDSLMWGSDYPHTESTFPRSRAILERILDGVPGEERRQITASNVARLYQFDAVAVS